MLDAQLTIFDALADLEQNELDMPRLGEGPELGELLLMPLRAHGWRLHRVRAFAGAEHPWLFILANETFQVRREGAALADVAVDLFEEASKLCGARNLG